MWIQRILTNALTVTTNFYLSILSKNSGGSSGEATEAGLHPHLSMNLNKNLFLRISILQICFYIIIILQFNIFSN
jgi:hypothetical protein